MKRKPHPKGPVLLLSEQFGVRLEMIAAGLLAGCREHGLDFSWRRFERVEAEGWGVPPSGIILNGGLESVWQVLGTWLGRLPIVSLSGDTLNLPVATITADVSGLSSTVVNHLLDEGAESILYIGPKGNPDSEWRIRETRAALAKRNKGVHFGHFNVEGNYDFWGRSSPVSRRLIGLLRRLPAPIGIISYTDRLGVNSVECALAAGLRVPHDALVVGTGNHPIYTSMEMPLSSVDIDHDSMGRLAVKIIVDAWREGRFAASPEHHCVAASLVVRESSRPRLVRDPQMVRLMKFLQNHYDKPLSLTQLAKEARMSKTSLADRFRRAVGEPPMRYLAHLRMERARALLAEPSLTIAEIAFSLGFGTAEYFTRSFRKSYGVSPTDFRRAARKGTRAPFAASEAKIEDRVG